MLTVGISEDLTLVHKDFAKSYHEKVFIELEELGEKKKALLKLQKMIQKHPHFSPFYGLLIAYYWVHDHEKAIEWTKKTYAKFPEDFTAKLAMAKYYAVVEDNMEGVYSIFGRDIKLSYAYPNRKLYHYTEFMNFVFFSVYIFLELDRLSDAEAKLAEIAPFGTDHQTYYACKKMIDNYKMTHLNLN